MNALDDLLGLSPLGFDVTKSSILIVGGNGGLIRTIGGGSWFNTGEVSTEEDVILPDSLSKESGEFIRLETSKGESCSRPHSSYKSKEFITDCG